MDIFSEMIIVPRWQSMGVATIYAKTHLSIQLNPTMGVLYPNSEGFLVIRIQNVKAPFFFIKCINHIPIIAYIEF